MDSGHGDPKVTTRALIRAAIPHDTAKTITRELISQGHEITYRQGRRIAAGNVPGKFRAALLEILYRALDRNRAAILRAEAELKVLRHGGMVRRAASRRAETDRPAAPEIPGLGERAGDASVTVE